MRADLKPTRWLVPVAMLFGFAAIVAISAHAEISLGERHSGYADLAPDTKAMQDDDTANPGMLWVQDGEALWNAKSGAANRACADCHNDARATMTGVAARYPAFDTKLGRPIDLEQRINLCRAERQQAPALAYESKELLSLSTFIGKQSRNEPIAPPTDERLRPFLEAGREQFNRRQGQLNLSCGQCHDDNWGKRLAGSLIPQAHPTGYPLYRLEWQAVGSLQRRLRNCLVGMRAEPYDYGAPEYVSLELYLMWRARGLPIETPAVRP
ncbi:MAG TPA: sulfur oxidation c-type cytochrome SoxA [Pseudolabrys sp.]